MVKYIPFDKYEKLVRRLRKLIRRGGPIQRRDALAMIVGLHGLRITEVRNLNVGDVDRIDELLTVRTLKGGKKRRVSLGPGVCQELRRLAGRRGQESPLFVTRSGKRVRETQLYRTMAEVTRDVFDTVVTKFHCFRHTFAMRLYAKSLDPQRVMARLGHRKMDSTQVYIEAYGELDDRLIESLAAIDVLPSLERRRARQGGGLQTPNGRRKRSRSSSRPLRDRGAADERVPNAVPNEKTGKNAVKNAQKRGIVRAKTESARNRHQKTTLAPSESAGLRLWKVNVSKELEREVTRIAAQG